MKMPTIPRVAARSTIELGVCGKTSRAKTKISAKIAAMATAERQNSEDVINLTSFMICQAATWLKES